MLQVLHTRGTRYIPTAVHTYRSHITLTSPCLQSSSNYCTAVCCTSIIIIVVVLHINDVFHLLDSNLRCAAMITLTSKMDYIVVVFVSCGSGWVLQNSGYSHPVYSVCFSVDYYTLLVLCLAHARYNSRSSPQQRVLVVLQSPHQR